MPNVLWRRRIAPSRFLFPVSGTIFLRAQNAFFGRTVREATFSMQQEVIPSFTWNMLHDAFGTRAVILARPVTLISVQKGSVDNCGFNSLFTILRFSRWSLEIGMFFGYEYMFGFEVLATAFGPFYTPILNMLSFWPSFKFMVSRKSVFKKLLGLYVAPGRVKVTR